MIEVAQKLYNTSTIENKLSKFEPDWNSYFIEGDSILVVKTQGVSINHDSHGKRRDLQLISGIVFRMNGEKVISVQKLEYYSNESAINTSGLQILSKYNKAKLGQINVADGTFIQYSVKHNRIVAGLSIKNGRIENSKFVSTRKFTDLDNNLQSSNKTTLRTSHEKVMSNGIEGKCDPVYLIIWDRLTGRVLSQTWLFDDCAEEDGAIIPQEPETGGESEEEDCSKAGDAVQMDVVGENNLIEPEPGTETVDSRNYIYQWVFLRNIFGWWSYKSTERGYHKKVGDEWQWDKLEHLNEGMQGISPATEITVSNFILQPTIGKYYATAKAYFNVKAKILCESKFNPIPGTNQNLTATCEVWNVNDIF